MHRRPIGRGRVLAVVGALVVLAGCVLPWYAFRVEGGLPSREFIGLAESGILSFIAALGTLALVALPYAAGDRPVSPDRGLAYLLLTGLAALGVAIWPFQVIDDLTGLLPDRAPGWWLALVGVAILGRAAFEIFQEPARR
ncbi:MAG TPA: hypothetical protein VGQ58_02595 [Candidatus Limnocylindrales bacterium]|jgi:hypothetical protein|nr:hypothetical protein [Candidatus Limnocylindrales bacterium]